MSDAVEVARILAWPLAAIAISGLGFQALGAAFRPQSAAADKPSAPIEVPTEEEGAHDEHMHTDVTPPPKAEVLIQESEEPEIETVSGPDESSEKPFYFTKEKNDIVALFEEFKESDSFSNDPEFWSTIFLDRKHELGLIVDDDEYEKLATENPNWIWPLLSLLNRCITRSEYVRGEDYLRSASLRENSNNRIHILVRGVHLYQRWKGDDGAYSYIRSEISNSNSNTYISSALRALRDRVTEESSLYDYTYLSEKSTQLNPSDIDDRFSLAYRYGEHDHMLNMSYTSYASLHVDDEKQAGALNNIAVIFGNISKNDAINIHYLERAQSSYSMSKANLAHRLIGAGFLDRAEILLSEIEVAGEASERKASAEAALHKARKKLQTEKDAFERLSAANTRLYRKAINLSYSSWISRGENFISDGIYSSDDIEVAVQNDIIAIRLEVDGVKMSGAINRQGIAYTGDLRADGSSILSGSRKIVAAPDGENLLIYIWPNNVSDGYIVERSCTRRIPGNAMIAAQPTQEPT